MSCAWLNVHMHSYQGYGLQTIDNRNLTIEMENVMEEITSAKERLKR